MRKLSPRSNYHILLLAMFAFPAMVTSASAGDYQREFVPEVNAFIKLSDQTRLFLLGDVTRNLTEKFTDGEVGAHLDITLKPRLRRQLQDADWERNRYLWIRIGFAQLGDLDGRSDGFKERRGILEATARVELPLDIWLVNRGRVDYRDVDDQSSKRYRYRLGIEREFTVGGMVMVPYAQAEVFYDTRFSAWNRELYQVGVEIGLTKNLRIEPYLARQNDTRSTPARVDRVGLVLKYFL